MEQVSAIPAPAPWPQAKTRSWLPLILVLSLTTASFSSIASATLLFRDDFDGTSVDGSKWHLPAWTPDGATFLGRTQLRVSQTVPLPLPAVSNGAVRLALSTYNPTALVAGDSFYGSEIITNTTFPIGGGIAIDVRARLVSPTSCGIVGGLFAYNAPTTAGGPHDEVDFELLGNRLNQVQTQVYANEPLGPGHPVFYDLPNGASVTDFHTYRMEIMPDRVSWYIDNQLLRTDTAHLPQGPMQFYLNVWAPGAEWSEAYCPGLQPSPTVSGNQDYVMEVDFAAITINSGIPPALVGISSRKAHGLAGTFDLPLGSVISNPTTEPRQGPAHAIVFTFDKVVTAGVATVTEGTATAGAPTFNGSEMILPLAGVTNQQYVTVAVSNVEAADGGTGGSGSVRIGFLLGDVSQNRVVTVSDLAQVNAQIAQFVTGANYLMDVKASGTLTVADKAITNTQITRALPAP